MTAITAPSPTVITLGSDQIRAMEQHVKECLEILCANAVGVRKDLLMLRYRLSLLHIDHMSSMATADELDERADFMLDLAQPVDDFYLAIGKDTSARTECGIDLDEFDEPLKRALDGFAEGTLRYRAERMRQRSRREEMDEVF